MVRVTSIRPPNRSTTIAVMGMIPGKILKWSKRERNIKMILRFSLLSLFWKFWYL